MRCVVWGMKQASLVNSKFLSIAMTSAQSRIAETLEIFYSAADRTSEGAMAGHAYKRSVDDLDTSFARELVSLDLRASITSH